MKFGKKLITLSKKNLILNLYTVKKHLKTKKKSFNGKINSNFHNNNILKEDSQYICVLVIMIDSVCKKDKNYYP